MNILSLDGGGTRGIYTLEILKSIEKELSINSSSLYDTFDFFAGTSTGAIIALGIACEIDLEKIKDLYLKQSKLIFKQDFKSKFIPFVKTFKSGQKKLETLMHEIFGDRKISELEDKRIIIPIYDLQEGNVKMIKTPHNKALVNDKYYYVYEVALAATSAPIYFNPTQLLNTNTNARYGLNIDGGVYNNNPTLSAILEAVTSLEQDIKDLNVLSIGTCRYTPQNRKISTVGLKFWGNNIFDTLISAQSLHTENVINYMNNNFLGTNNNLFNYLRINENLERKIPLFTCKESDFNELASMASKSLKVNSTKINKFIMELTNG